MTEQNRLRHSLPIILVLVVVTAVLYWPMVHHPFIGIDDHDYIYDTPQVTGGITASGVAWAFTTGHASNWHPLTWISHMLDCQIFGINPGGHHLTNLLFHLANTSLLFFLLRQLTGATFRSAFVAALFAWHPLHVESVAWASERKDVLCAFFWFLATMTYVRYVRERQPKFYWWTIFLLALGLMSKPMLVTFPFALLLLDFWPLQRIRLTWLASAEAGATNEGHDQSQSFISLVREKVPMFALVFVSSIATYLVQSRGGAVSSLQAISPLLRIENAVASYARYLLKTFWPTHLAAIYPYPKTWPAFWVIGAIALLAAISIWAAYSLRRRPYLLVGWLWFLGTLVPTIGLIQVGSQSMADRYMYIPAIGLFIALIWWLHDLFANRSAAFLNLLALAGCVALVACVMATREQLATWRSSEALFRHAIAVTRDNYIALDGLGSALDDAGRSEEAFKLFEESVRIEPRYPEAQYDLGTLLLRRGEFEQAIVRFRKALKDNPKFTQAHSNLGTTFLRQGNLPEAEKCFLQAVALQPRNAEGHYNLATVQIADSRLGEAITNLVRAIRLKPDYAPAHGNLGVTLMRIGQVEQGTRHLQEVVRLDPRNPEAHFNFGLAMLDQGRPADAASSFARALELKPREPKYLCRLAVSLARAKKFSEAITCFRETLKEDADFSEALNELAWILSTNPEADLRDGGEAIRLAERAAAVTKREMPVVLLTLGATYAEVGRFADAVGSAQEAEKLAAGLNQKSMVERAAKLLKVFEARQPYRE